jgi:hypothetical protein
LSALAEGIKQRQWWDESRWKIEKTGSDIRIWKVEWFSVNEGVYLYLRPRTSQPAFDLAVYGRPTTFSSKFVHILKKYIERQYPEKDVDVGGFIKRLTGVNTFLEKTLTFSFTEKDQVEMVLKSLDDMVNQFEKTLDDSFEEFKK